MLSRLAIARAIARATVGALAVMLIGIGRAEGSQPSLRKLCIDASTVVLAEPVDPITPTRFKVVLVLRGKDARAGQTLAPAGLTEADVKTYDEKDLETGKLQPRRISRALLFLKAGTESPLLPGGLRMCTEDGRVLVPVSAKSPKEKSAPLEVQPRLSWPGLIERVRSDVASVEALQACRRIGRAPRRTQALLDWVRRRRGEFVAAPSDTQADDVPAGWEELQFVVFDWALAGTGPEDAWSVVKLYAELNRGELVVLRQPIFSTPAGRAFLAMIARDDREVTSERRRAMRLLRERMTLWPAADERRIGAKGIETNEQTEILLSLTSLLKAKDDSLRAAVVRTIARLSLPEGKEYQKCRTARAVPMLISAYRSAPPGPLRDELSGAICSLAPASQWKELTGNPAGMCVCLRDLEREGDTVSFWLSRPAGDAVREQPVLLLEKLGAIGFVTETKRLPLQVLNLEGGWAAGWTGETALAVRMDLPGLVPGSTYRLRVEGFVGTAKDRRKWISEPKRFQLPAAKQQGRNGMFGNGMIGD